MVKDPVCGMDIEEKNAVGTSEYEGKTYYFCSEVCKDKFDKDPSAFIGTGISVSKKKTSEKGEIFTCPMDPEVQQEGPGACPKCGMALEPLAPSITPSKTEWICPMDPEIVRDKPGNCPKCGMALEPRTAVAGEEEKNPELIDMTRRFWVSVFFSTPLIILVMGGLIPGISFEKLTSREILGWVELILATPVVLWG